MKKNLMKKTIALAAGLALSIPLFVACGTQQTKETLTYDNGVVRAFHAVSPLGDVVSQTAYADGQGYLVTVITPSSVSEYSVDATFQVGPAKAVVGDAPVLTALEVTEETEVPETPETSETPDVPETPDTPDTPAEPDTPDTPDVTDTPAEPETPALSDLERAFEKALELSGIAKTEIEGFDFDKTLYMGKTVFKVEIEDAAAEYSYIFNAEDLSLIESKTELKQTAPSGETSSYIGEARAKEIALDAAGISESQAQNFTLKDYLDGGRKLYRASFDHDGSRYTVEIDALNGDIVKFAMNVLDAEAQTPDIPQTITEEQAKAAALAFAFPGGTDGKEILFRKVKLDYEKGKFLYEIEFTADGNEYEFEIDASDGTILDVEIEKEDTFTPPQSGEFITREQAVRIVRNTVGEDAFILDVEIEVRKEAGQKRYYYEIEVKANGRKLEYYVDALTGEITSNDDYAGNPVDPTPALTEDDALQIALDDFGLTADMLTYKRIKLEREDGKLCYEIKLLVGTTEYEMSVDAQTGAILEKEIDREHGEELPPQVSDRYITPQEARKAVEDHLKAAGRTGYIKDVELEDRGSGANKSYYYEVEIVVDGREYDCYVDAVTGEVTLRGELVDGNQTLIGEERALSIALEYFSFTKAEVRLIKIELDEDDGLLIYEVEYKVRSMEYTVEIDAVTGEVLDFDKSFD